MRNVSGIGDGTVRGGGGSETERPLVLPGRDKGVKPNLGVYYEVDPITEEEIVVRIPPQAVFGQRR